MPLTVFFSSAGTYTIDDDGIRGNGTSVVRDSDGNVLFPFAHPADTLTFIADVPGVNLIFNALDSFGAANVTVGNLTDPGQSPDSIVVKSMQTDAFVTLVANGSITEGGADAPADIVAAAVVLSAASGVGTSGNAIETQTTFIEAETTSGGINIANFGQVQIGGVTANVDGLDVATSGNLSFSATGGIFIADTSGPEMLHGGETSGNVTLTAIGGDSDIYATINAVTVRAAGGGVTLNAGRDVLIGIGGANYDNDILATNFVAINAGRDFILDGNSNIRTSAFGGILGGPIDIETGRNITLSNTTGGLQSIEAFLGNVTLTTGPGGTYLQNAAFSAAVQSSGDIIVNTDNLLLASGGLNTTGVGSVTVRPVTPGRAINIGSTLDPTATLAVSEAELDRMFTLNINIGDEDSGPVEFTAPVSPNTFPTSLVVTSASEIFINSSITLEGSLTLRAGHDIYMSPGASFTSTAVGGTFNAFVDSVQDDGGDGGIGTLGGTITASAINLTGNLDADQLNGTSEADALRGMAGSDVLNGFGGSDFLDGGTNADTMVGGTGNDNYVVNGSGDVIVEASGEGTDTLLASASYTLAAGVSLERMRTVDAAATTAINLTGNELGQTITGNSGANVLSGGDGVDVLEGGLGNDTLNGGFGTDTASFSTASAFVVVSLAIAGPQNTRVGIDTLSGIERLSGSDFNDQLTGDGGINRLDGGLGNDVLAGGGGNDTFFGGDGDDRMEGGAGDDILNGNTGRDTAVYSSAGSGVTVSLAIAVPQATGGAGNDTLNSIERVVGSNFVDVLTGNTSNNVLFGEDGSDTISGDSGSDVIYGGGGNDALSGGAGQDNFIFDTALNGVTNVDQIGDFTVNYDRVRLDIAIFTAAGPLGTLSAAAFHTGAGAADSSDRIIYNNATGNIFYDADGNGAGAQVLFAHVTAGTLLSNADFFVI